MLKTEKIDVGDLEVGMFVSQLDRPWLETPFLLQGFLIESQQDIEAISNICTYVYIDRNYRPNRDEPVRKLMLRAEKTSVQALFPDHKLQPYHDKHNWNLELPKARAALETLGECVKGILTSRDKIVLDMPKIKKAVEPMIESITRNPDACLWLGKMRSVDDYSFNHSLGCAIWSVALGRQLGLAKPDLRSLGIGGLLFDVGKLKVDRALLTAPRPLTGAEFEQVKNHVKLGVQALRKSGVINKDVLEMVAYHHERYDGSGYPFCLAGEKIPVFARIAAIADSYDAMTSNRAYAKALPPAKAIKLLYEKKGIDFQAELVEEFIQAVGIYPAGSLVELTSGEVAVVLAEYRARRLRPQVMVVLDENKEPLIEVKVRDLMKETHNPDGSPLEILGSLEPDAYGINLASIAL